MAVPTRAPAVNVPPPPPWDEAPPAALPAPPQSTKVVAHQNAPAGAPTYDFSGGWGAPAPGVFPPGVFPVGQTYGQRPAAPTARDKASEV
jgi:hypothetical protein